MTDHSMAGAGKSSKKNTCQGEATQEESTKVPSHQSEPRMSQVRQDALETAFVLIEILRALPKSSHTGRKVTAKQVQEHLASVGYVRDVRPCSVTSMA